MPNYFKNFPESKYDGKISAEIYRRTKIANHRGDDPYLFLPYTLSDGDSAELVSHYYYGSIDQVWLVYLANEIIDPYHEWLMDEDSFAEYLVAKYRERSGMSGYDVYNWTMDETRSDNIEYYQDIENEDIKISPENAQLDPTFIYENYVPKRVFDVEYEKNEDRRNIQLINKVYAEEFQTELKRLLNE